MAAAPLAERFAARVAEGPDGHLLWTGHTNARGYGLIHDGGRQVAAHRVAWQLARGRRPPRGMVVAHTCDRPECVAIEHLQLMRRRRVAREKLPTVAANLAKTHCARGHRLAGKNVYRWRGQRHCRTCHRERVRERYHADRAAT